MDCARIEKDSSKAAIQARVAKRVRRETPVFERVRPMSVRLNQTKWNDKGILPERRSKRMATSEVAVSQAKAETVTDAGRTPDPCIVVIFGASGDLTKRKLLPALYHLDQQNLLPADFSVVGVARRDLSKTFAPDMKDGIVKGGGVEESEEKLGKFVEKIDYFATNFDDDAGFEKLKAYLVELDGQGGHEGEPPVLPGSGTGIFCGHRGSGWASTA